jgi:hypothetical protein
VLPLSLYVKWVGDVKRGEVNTVKWLEVSKHGAEETSLEITTTFTWAKYSYLYWEGWFKGNFDVKT